MKILNTNIFSDLIFFNANHFPIQIIFQYKKFFNAKKISKKKKSK
jgi:hypothetical protein